MLVFATFGVACAGARIPLPNPDLDLLTNAAVYAIATQPDGGVVFGGSFSAVDGEPRSNIARLSPSGQLDPAWNPAADDAVLALAIRVDGAVYAGGAFRTIGGYPRIAIARLAGASGQLDAHCDAFLPDNTLVYALTLSADGDVFAACSYVRGFVTKLSRDEGKPVTEFTTAYVGDSTYVHVLALGADGALYVGGTFTGIGAYARDRIARLSATTGAVDGDWAPRTSGTPADGVVTLVADAHGALLLGGPFGVQKLTSPIAGSVDSWHTIPADVRALALGEDHSIYVAGYFV